ncbi:hypothetical protein GOBAR_DD27898 [Gossypium barbadense]|nr:hypothetical protein GOBAR_DD27898 [Gossypium barbadense]
MESAPSSASFKRARPPGSGNQVPSCLVDGCTADLSKCRDYHRHHKVCEVHSKTPKVSIRGQEQRFCQQCSRFHSLVEFDEGKRSCRKRLDGHNRRRRKPQPNALTVNSGSLLSNPPQMTQFSLQAAQVNLALSQGFKHQISNLKVIAYEVSVCQPLVNANPSSSNGGISQKMLLNGLNRTVESNRALSLLSSQPAETREISLSPMMQSGSTSSLIPNLQYKGLGMEGEQVGTILATDQSANTDLHGNGVFRIGHPGSSASGTHHRLTFSWE